MTDKLLLSIIEKVKKGISIERSGLDLKRKWWNLETYQGLEEFLKDVCSMANAQTGDSYIVVGIDEATGKIYDAPLPDDEANIQSKHKDEIEPRVKLLINEYKIEGKTLSVLTIPHSLQRPHVIKKYSNWRNWIPVRFGTSTLTASRSDLDEMYQERYKSHTSDIHIRLFEEKLRWGKYSQFGGYCFMVRLSVDNYGGGAPDYIVKVALHGSNGGWKSRYFMFEGMMLDQELRVGAHERKLGTQLYLSDLSPDESVKKRAIPEISSEPLHLSVYCRSGKSVDILIKTEFLEK